MRRVNAGVALVVAVAAGCSSTGSGSSPAAEPRPSPASAASAQLTGCQPSLLPSGYVVDTRHSGRLTAHNYSQSADVQAALVFDQMSGGARRVYVHHRSGAASRIDAVASCVTMQFPDAHVANRFFLSYRSLRDHAGSLVTRVPIGNTVPALTGLTAYREMEQSFRGYRIASTTVVEAAGQANRNLDIVSVAGSRPSTRLARALLASLAGGA
jgi:hypothetical protein